jgi:hypothetical protein
MDSDPELGWPCVWVKITQLYGLEHCYLPAGHTGDHLFKGSLPSDPGGVGRELPSGGFQPDPPPPGYRR